MNTFFTADRFRSRFSHRRQSENYNLYFSTLLPAIEPGSVMNYDDAEAWRSLSLEGCVADGANRECNPHPGDVVDHSIVSR